MKTKPEHQVFICFRRLGVFILFLLIISATIAKSQIPCGSIAGEFLPLNKDVFQHPKSYSLTVFRHVNAAVHIVRYNDGSGGLTTTQLDVAIQQLNTAFLPAMIGFVVTSIDFIDDDTYGFVTEEEAASFDWAVTVSRTNLAP